MSFNKIPNLQVSSFLPVVGPLDIHQLLEDVNCKSCLEGHRMHFQRKMSLNMQCPTLSKDVNGSAASCESYKAPKGAEFFSNFAKGEIETKDE